MSKKKKKSKKATPSKRRKGRSPAAKPVAAAKPGPAAKPAAENGATGTGGEASPRAVYQAARDLMRRRLWDRLDDVDWFLLETPDRNVPSVVSVLGSAGVSTGLWILEGAEGLELLERTQRDELDEASFRQILLELDTTMLNPARAANLPRDLRRFVRQAGVNPRGDAEVPMLVLKPAGMRPHVPAGAELERCLWILRGLEAADREGLLISGRMRDGEQLATVVLSGTPQAPQAHLAWRGRPSAARPDEPAPAWVPDRAALDDLPRRRGTWIVGLPPLAQGVADSQEVLHALLVLEEGSGRILDSHVLEHRRAPYAAAEQLVEIARGDNPAKQRGLPQELLVADRALHELLAPEMKRLGVRCHHVAPPPASLREAAASLHEYLERSGAGPSSQARPGRSHAERRDPLLDVDEDGSLRLAAPTGASDSAPATPPTQTSESAPSPAPAESREPASAAESREPPSAAAPSDNASAATPSDNASAATAEPPIAAETSGDADAPPPLPPARIDVPDADDVGAWRAVEARVLRLAIQSLPEASAKKEARCLTRYFGSEADVRDVLAHPRAQALAFDAYIQWRIFDHRPRVERGGDDESYDRDAPAQDTGPGDGTQGPRRAPSRRTREGRTHAERLLAGAVQGVSLTPPEQRLLEAMSASPTSLYVVRAVTPGRFVRFEDTLRGGTVEVRDRSLSEAARVGHGITARVYPVGSTHFIAGIGPVFPPLELANVLDLLHSLDLHTTPKALRRGAHLLGRLWSFHTRRSPMPELLTPDGDEVVIHQAIYRVRDEDQARRALRRAGGATLELDEQTGVYHWLASPAAPGAPAPGAPEPGAPEPAASAPLGAGPSVIARIGFGEGGLWAETNSDARWSRLQALLEGLPGVEPESHERFDRDELIARGRQEVEARNAPDDADDADDATEAMDPAAHRAPGDDADFEARRAPDEAMDATAPAPGIDLSDPEVRESLRQQLLPRQLAWLDEQVPALDGQTPRQAVATAEGRRLVQQLIRTMPAIGFAEDVEPLEPPRNELRRQLGLPEEK